LDRSQTYRRLSVSFVNRSALGVCSCPDLILKAAQMSRRAWAREVQAQERELGIFFDAIIVCSVTGSTQAGMVAGFADEARGGGCSES